LYSVVYVKYNDYTKISHIVSQHIHNALPFRGGGLRNSLIRIHVVMLAGVFALLVRPPKSDRLTLVRPPKADRLKG